MTFRAEVAASGERRVVVALAAEAALAIAVDEALVNQGNGRSGCIEIHFGPDGIQLQIHLRGARRPRLTARAAGVLDSR